MQSNILCLGNGELLYDNCKSLAAPGSRDHQGDFRKLGFKKSFISYFYPVCLLNTNVWTLCVAIEYSEMCLGEGVKKIYRIFHWKVFVESGIQQKENNFWTFEMTIELRNYLNKGKHWIENFSLFFKSALMLCKIILMLDISGTQISLYLAMAEPGLASLTASQNKILQRKSRILETKTGGWAN